MPRKKSSARRSPRTGDWWGRTGPRLVFLVQLSLILALPLAAYVIWLDHRITTEFEGNRWSIPARVYASPYRLYIGQQAGAQSLERELQVLNYERKYTPGGPGTYARNGDTVEIVLRPFHYWDVRETGRHLRLEFDAGRLQRLVNPETGAEPAFVRLEPRLLGKIYPEHNEDRVLVANDDVPPFLLQALIAVEDRNFFDHLGVDPRGIGRAILVNLGSGELAQGGSTLTQQLVKNYFLTPERTFWRKLNEMVMALLLERHYSKAEILHAYVNEVYLGQAGARGIHGFGTAAEFYFDRPLGELRPDQLALLAGLVRGASYYNPQRHPGRARERRNLVLQLMRQQGYIEQSTAETLLSRPLDLTAARAGGQRHAAFLQAVRRELLEDYRLEDLRNAGLRIFTTLEPVRQERMANAASQRLLELEAQHSLEPGTLQTAMLSVDIGTGEVIAMLGGRDDAAAGFNRALDARRPVGSLIKPFVYHTALARPDRYHLLSGLDDIALRIQQPDGSLWQPDNYDQREHGEVSLLEAMTQSYNIATVRLGMQIGVPSVIDTLQRAGLDADLSPYPSLLLGALELSPYQVAQLYQTLANGGYRAPLKSIREVLDREGRPLQRRELQIQQALQPQAAFLTNYLLTQVVETGTASQLRSALPGDLRLAGKTGTTNDYRDSWFAGYDDQVLTVFWMGRDDYRPTSFTGASGAMQLWQAAMLSAGLRSLNLVASDQIQWLEDVNIRQAEDCVSRAAVPYIRGHQPAGGMLCQAATDNSRFSFNPLRWFQ